MPNKKTGKQTGKQIKSKQAGRNVPMDIETHPTRVLTGNISGKTVQSNTSSATPDTAPEIVQVDKPVQKYVPQINPAMQEKMWKPGQSGNPAGRPKDQLKALGLRIAQLKANKVLKPSELQTIQALGLDTADITMIEALMVQLATSKNPVKVEMYLQRTFGNVPNININAQVNETIVTRFKSKFTDSELERIAQGEDATEILFDKLPDVDGADNMAGYIDAESQSIDADE